MLPLNMAADDAGVRPLAEEDQQTLLSLVRRYGLSSIMCALTGPASSRASMLSATTLLSSAPSLAWTASSDASQCRSDAASIRTQSTWPETANDVRSIHEASELGKLPEATWLDSPAIMGSPLPGHDITSAPSPRLPIPTNKKYQCPMCFQDNNPVGFGRKSDFKKHLHNFHGADVVWICRTRGCHLTFATERAYSTHAKDVHRMDALPNSAARTELCPQLVFSCGFASCKDRIFEAQNKEESSSSRDKYFEHIAKHFEDGFDVSNWEYHTQVHNLMRQQKVKPVWKTCIWPKEKRQALVWKPRSSGDLRRMLECRHLGEDISTLVRLAYILGTAPFSSSNTPPPSEIDLHFQLPFRSQCLVDTEPPSASPNGSPTKGDGSPLSNSLKHRTSMPQAMLSKLPNRRSKRENRPPTPGSVVSDTPMRDSVMRDDQTMGPHPGTPIPIPHEAYLPSDAPIFAPPESAHVLPKQSNSPPQYEQPHQPPPPQQQQQPHHHQQQGQMLQHQQHEQQQHQQQEASMHHHEDIQPDPPVVYTMSQQHEAHHQSWNPNTSMSYEPVSAAASIYSDSGPIDIDEYYNYPLSTSQASTMRPPTPTPNKRPASFGRNMSMESLRPTKKVTPYGSPCPDEEIPPAMMYGSGPTSVPMHMAMDGYAASAYDLPMRMGHEEAQHHDGFPALASLPPQMQLNSATTFFFDDEARF